MRDSEQVWFEARRETSDGLFDTDPDGVIRSWENHDYFRRKYAFYVLVPLSGRFSFGQFSR